MRTRCATTFTRDTARRHERYSYYVGTDEEAASPFRRRTEWAVHAAARRATRSHAARRPSSASTAFAPSPSGAPRRPTTTIAAHVRRARVAERPGGLVFEIEANRFLHHMVRFLVGTMIDIALGRRAAADVGDAAPARATTRDVSPPAPPHALFLDRVCYPADLYLSGA